jgi:hypothetical protein
MLGIRFIRDAPALWSMRLIPSAVPRNSIHSLQQMHHRGIDAENRLVMRICSDSDGGSVRTERQGNERTYELKI